MLSPDVVRRLTVVATDNGLTTLTAKLNAVDAAQDRVALSGTRMGRATEDAQRRIAALSAQGTTALGGLAGSAGATVLGVIGRFAPAILAAYAGFKLLNETVSQGVALLEKYGIAGQRALFDENNGDALAKLLKFQGDKTTLPNQKYAAELSGRLEEANRQIKEFFRVSLDLTDPALKLQNYWIVIVETIAKGLGLLSRWSATSAAAVPNTTGAGRLPGVGSDQDIINRMNRNNGFPEVSGEEAMRIARGRLGAGLAATGMIGKDQSAGFYGRFNAVTDKPEKEEKQTLSDEFSRFEKSLERQAAAMEAESKSVGESIGKHAALRAEYRLQEAALQDIAKSGGAMEDYEERIKKISDRIGEATQKAAELRLNSDLGFERSQLGRSDSEANVASRLRPIYGDAYATQMNSAVANQIRLNEQLKVTKGLTDEFANSVGSNMTTALADIATGAKSAGDAFRGLGQTVLRSLEEMIIKMTITIPLANALKSSLGLGGLFGGLFNSSPVAAGNAAVGASGLQFHNGGIVGQGGTPRYVHPAYFENAPRYHLGIDEVPAILQTGERVIPRGGSAGAGSATPTYQDNRQFIIDARGATPDAVALLNRKIDQLRAETPNLAVAAVGSNRSRNPGYLRSGR